MLLLFTGAVLPTPAEQTYSIRGDVSAPKLISKVEPNYTKKAKREKISGTVLLSLVIGPDGMAKKIAVIKGLDSGLDKNAIKAVSKWRFEPGKKDGKPVFVQAHVEVQFRLL
jgi:TonB family protein